MADRNNEQGGAQATCGTGTGSDPASFQVPESSFNHVKRVIAVMSGKGGVGKSTVTALLASNLAKAKYKVGVLDADITGPSIPKLFGLKDKPWQDERGILPVESTGGIKIMSLNLLLPDETEPVIWRGPLIGSAIKQFWTDVVWGELDYLVLDLPPGTSDATLTVLQSLPLDGVVMVSTPQELATMIVIKAARMVDKMGVPMLGLVENMSYTICPHCNEKIRLFGDSRAEDLAEGMGLDILAVLPVDPQLTSLSDEGRIEEYDLQLNKLIQTVTAKLPVG
ncbi:MAG: Mrp/NBP35 family ATP-binding protein [Bacillota bacterium]